LGESHYKYFRGLAKMRDKDCNKPTPFFIHEKRILKLYTNTYTSNILFSPEFPKCKLFINKTRIKMKQRKEQPNLQYHFFTHSYTLLNPQAKGKKGAFFILRQRIYNSSLSPTSIIGCSSIHREINHLHAHNITHFVQQR